MSHITLDGYIDTTPETNTGTTVHFDLIHSPDHQDPTEPDAPEQLYACTTDHPAAAELVLHQAKLGDLLRVTHHRNRHPRHSPHSCASTPSTSSTSHS
ncbi:hypothetical protein AB0G48_19225 [Streptomyces rubiginosohelvolus]|uniref:hypothetical protein n=1 Tax=Streptomyces rubiginosohelvolus TaxID=67362 RepID=UPI0033C5D10D